MVIFFEVQGEKNEYKKLLKKLLPLRDQFIFCYSHAHLLDLQNDKTQKKFDELTFMERLVKDNYLSYHALDKVTSCYLALPREAFDSLLEEEQIKTENIFDLASLELPDSLKKLLDNFLDTKLDLGGPVDFQVPEDYPQIVKEMMGPENPNKSLREHIDYFLELNKRMNEDNSLYKQLRNYSNSRIKNKNFVIKKGDVDFEWDADNTSIKTSLSKFLDPTGQKTFNRHEFYTNAYFSIDLVGFQKESSKNLKFRNLINDAYHSYYGAYSDCVVSDDQGFLNKTKVLYKIFEIETKVMEPEEFISSFDFSIKSIESDADMFKDILLSDIKKGFITETKKSLRFNRTTQTIKPTQRYLGYFNFIDVFNEDGKNYINFYRRIKNYSNFSFLREYELIVNNAVKVFGIDKNFKSQYEWEKENAEIKNDKWEGRFWDFQEFTILIEINEGLKDICMLFSFNEL